MSYIDVHLVVSEDVDGFIEYHGAYVDKLKADEIYDQVLESKLDVIVDCWIEDLTVSLE
jgi:hypothetical protein